ncbi:MAG: pyridoxal-5'-phosphate-dependent protein [Candidatus Buchananbacteria bacterium RIFCSPHIGHO2_02_FULL_45_11b]|uniref:Pyridoxal-5'-phosphate-dependent protein n=2 Tax=Candidatus Buchananiibacteriota TaxID=1817903 RepID=A0A1G1YD48_9BACT|nr:MAG: pyridoxal-5'-phosphate-dependent protein [Candidatus Buchananbacteria bacterium RIFCSPHIGHO2_02_FULL_45_11b]OGY58064.1 MAG: pyridoxal-5'-phosphate-dependent protein [Candidatus Buchananbacteria bacterium RIFCSPLOWO2_02_FULL_46_11b]
MIPVFKPAMGQEEIEAISQVIKSGWLGLGPKTEQFEKEFAEYLGVKYALALNSATAALHLALMVLAVKDREVITTPMTFVSTNHAILYNQGRPVFTDIETDTLNINPEEIKKNLTKKTKAIMAVHYGGQACRLEEIIKLAKDNNLSVVEDCAHACGGEYKGKKLGTFGDLACFSFHAVKNLATGDGGMIVTNNKEWHERLKKLRWLGINKDTWEREESEHKERGGYSWSYNVEELGFKYHMNDLNSALGLVQLAKLDKMNEKRRILAKRYDVLLKDVKEIELPVEKEYAKSSWHNYVIKTSARDRLNLFLADRGISTGVHYIPNNHYLIYQKYGEKTPAAEAVWTKLLTLPLYPDLAEDEQDSVINGLKDFFKGAN